MKPYLVGPPINIDWSKDTVITVMAETSLGMLGILYIITWLIQQGPVFVQPGKKIQCLYTYPPNGYKLYTHNCTKMPLGNTRFLKYDSRCIIFSV